MNHAQAVTVLHELAQARERTRTSVRGLWFPLVLFGALMIGSALVVAAISGPAVAVYWALAGPLGGGVCWTFFRRRGLARGVEPRQTLPVVGGLAIIAGCFLGYWVGDVLVDATFAATVPFLVISVAYQIPAHRESRSRFGVTAVGLGASALALGLSNLGPVTVSALLSAGYGFAFMLYGLTYRAEERATR
ncbi:MAG TPA: hypothetical protein VI916_12795 [Acidimicrobiia bacterium]|nr:hypothetical protein [Acidimicrobiia bacterium]